MTISPTRSAELSVAEIVVTAFERAGLKNEAEDLDEVRQSKGRRELKLILDRLSVHGRVARLVIPTPVTLIADQEEYLLAVGTIDVESVATSSGRVLSPITLEQHLILKSGGTESGTPLQYYVDRTGAQVSLKFWQVPSSSFAGEIVTVQREVFRADVAPGTVTPDLERYWVDAIVWDLAHVLAVSANRMGRANYLKGLADMGLKDALNRSRPKGVTQVSFSAPNPWRGN